MKYRKLGKNGPKVSAIGLGCMSFAGFFGETDEATSHRCLDAALDHGIDFLDTAELYGMGLSENIIGSFLKQKPNAFKLATKGGIVIKPERRFDNSRAYLENALDGSMKRLGVDYIDLYYIHRREQDRPIEEVVETLKGFIDAGKIGGYGLSEISPTTLRRAHAVHPCTAVQNEYSLWTRLPDLGLIRTCAELGVAFVPFSPVARGMLTDAQPNPATMRDTDFRRTNPRFVEPNFSDNRAMIAKFSDWANDRGLTTSAAALAWLLHRGDHLIPIPATRYGENLAQWANAADISFSADDMAEIETILPAGWAYGDRYNDAQSVGPERFC
ncbi:aldo/keto reductase [Amylibacter kogurei]|uniref:Aldo/keto reductase n=1 Tax=Paramylibacter kogurei TaxID=1889778 RepID=A0A2G5K804_9RHOB|nr:aldo/keto reductase [Amylibacter kogurei]PIB25666.1 aldo/keto reductase [Amylibacter kogurei]